MENKNEKIQCIFCEFVNGKIPICKVWENSSHLAFLDQNPINPGHTLLIPKKHTNYIFDLSDKEYSELMMNAKNIAKLLKNKLKPKRVGIAVEGFGVPHVHIHLVPLNKGNELNPERARHMDSKELAMMAQKIAGK